MRDIAKYVLILQACAAWAGGAAAGGEVTGPLVVSEAWPQCTDIKTWADDVLRIEGKTAAGDREKALTLYQWTRFFVMGPKNGGEPYEGPYGAETWQFDRHKVFFVWGCGDCGFQSAAHEAVWCYYNNDNSVARSIRYQAAGHVMCEVKWGGTWHAYDPLNGVYFIDTDSPTANVLSFAQIAGEDQLLRDNETFANRCRPFFERVRSWDTSSERKDLLDITGFAESYTEWQAGGSDPHVVYPTYGSPVGGTWWDMNWRMPRGMEIERFWDSGDVFYVPQVNADKYSTQGRHYRQATDWGADTTNWNAAEDIYNFPKCEPYLKLCDDPTEAYFYGYHSYFLANKGTMTYAADLGSDAYLDAVDGTPGLVRSGGEPYLRPAEAGTTEEIRFRFRCPFILADGNVAAEVECGAGDTAELSISVDDGATWDTVATGAGVKNVNIGQARYDGAHQTVTGNYEFLVKFECEAVSDTSTVGLNSFVVDAIFDNSSRTLPRITDGTNTIHFKVEDAGAVSGPITVEYRWLAGAAEESHTETIQPGDFTGDVATYQFDATGLTGCVSYKVSYGAAAGGDVEAPQVEAGEADMTGTVSDANMPDSVLVGGVSVPVTGGNWTAAGVTFAPGVPIPVVAEDVSGNTRTVNVTVSY